MALDKNWTYLEAKALCFGEIWWNVDRAFPGVPSQANNFESLIESVPNGALVSSAKKLAIIILSAIIISLEFSTKNCLIGFLL